MTKSSDVLPDLTPELAVRDISKSLDFYIRLLGFSVKFERKEEGFAAIGLDTVHFPLEETDVFELFSENEFIEKRKWLTGKLEYPFGRGINFMITTDRIDGIYNTLKENSYPIKVPMEEKWYKVGKIMVGVKQFLVMGRDGYLLRFDKVIDKKQVTGL